MEGAHTDRVVRRNIEISESTIAGLLPALDHRSTSNTRDKPSVGSAPNRSRLTPIIADKVAEIFAKHHQLQAEPSPKKSLFFYTKGSFSLHSRRTSISVEGVTSPRCERIVAPRPPRKQITAPPPTFRPRKQLKPIKALMTEVPNESMALFREWSLQEWLKLMRDSMGLWPLPSSNTFKYYVGKGNNEQLIYQIMKTRWWWTRVDNPALANFIWTQTRHKPTLQRIAASPLAVSSVKKAPRVTIRLPRYLLNSKTEALGFNLIKKSGWYRSLPAVGYDTSQLILHNKVPGNDNICYKKSLLKNISNYYKELGVDPFSKIPLSFHVCNVEELTEFASVYKPGSLWIVKPGEETNQGRGITVSNSLEEIKQIVEEASEGRTYIVQQYITRPLLIQKRKFDIRCFGLVTCMGSQIHGYFYKEGYIRTSSKEFSLKKPKNKYIHLTNDAVQKYSESYGKFENGNKMSYAEFEKYLAPHTSFYHQILPQIRQGVADSIQAVHHLLSNGESSLTFEVFGYDFMVDRENKVWLIEVNTNPCLELSSPYLASLIPAMLENAFKLSLDPFFPPPADHKKYKSWAGDLNISNAFELVFSHPY